MSSQASAARWNPWTDRGFLLFSGGNVVNNVGEAIYNIALPLLAYQVTGSLVVMSLLAALVPATLVLGPLVGVAVDRYGAGRLLLLGLLVQLAAGTVLNLLALSSSVSLPLVFLAAATVQIGGTAYRAGWMAGVATMFPKDSSRARGSLGTLYVGTGIAGAALVGLLLPLTGYQVLLWLNVATFLAPLAVYVLGVRPAPASSDGTARSLRRELAIGFQTIRRHPQLLGGMLAVTPLLFVASGGLVALLTFFLLGDLRFAASTVGYLLALVRLGSLAGTIVVSQARNFRPRRVIHGSAVVMGVALLAISVGNRPIVVAALFALFSAIGAMSVMADMLVFQYVPADLLGRASGALSLVEGAPGLVAPLLIPVITELTGRSGAFAVLGLVALSALFLGRSASPEPMPEISLNSPAAPPRGGRRGQDLEPGSVSSKPEQEFGR